MKLKKGDKIIVIAGKARGESGTISRVLPKENRVLVDGINLVKRHRKPSAQSRTGQIVEKPMTMHASNVQIADPKTGKPSRIRITRGKDGLRQRVAVKSGEMLK